MVDAFKIFVDQLREGNVRQIQENCPSSFMGINEEELIFNQDVVVEGEAYLAVDNLVIHLNAWTHASIPCSICNEWVEVELRLNDFYLIKPIEEIKSAIFDFTDLLREEILLEVPQFAECGGGQCPSRKEIQGYLKKPDDHQNVDEGYHPFADL